MSGLLDWLSGAPTDALFVAGIVAYVVYHTDRFQRWWRGTCDVCGRIGVDHPHTDQGRINKRIRIELVGPDS